MIIRTEYSHNKYNVVLVLTSLNTQHTTDVRDKDNKTPLHCACEGGSKDVVQYLVEEVKCDVGEF